MASTSLIEKRNELKAKQEKLRALLAKAGGFKRLDLTKLADDFPGKSPAEIVKDLRGKSTELADLKQECQDLAQLEHDAAASIKEVPADGPVRAGDTPFVPVSEPEGETKGQPTIGDLIVKSAAWTDYNPEHPNRVTQAAIPNGVAALKATFQRSAGWEPESTRIGRLVDSVVAPVRVIDIVAGGRTTQAAIVYMEETTRTDAAAERNENAAYAESAFALTERSVTIQLRNLLDR